MTAVDTAPKTNRAAQFARATAVELRLRSGKVVTVQRPEYVTAFANGLLPVAYRDIIGRYVEDSKAIMARPLHSVTDEQRMAIYAEMMQVIDCTCVVCCVDPPVRFVAITDDQVSIDQIDPIDRLSIWRWSVGLPDVD